MYTKPHQKLSHRKPRRLTLLEVDLEACLELEECLWWEEDFVFDLEVLLLFFLARFNRIPCRTILVILRYVRQKNSSASRNGVSDKKYDIKTTSSSL